MLKCSYYNLEVINMNNTAMLISSMLSNLFGGLIKKRINDKYENNIFSYQIYNAVVSFSSALCLLIMSDNLSVSFYTIILSLLFGIITLAQQIFNLYALENGPLSYTTVIISLSTLIPTVSGALFWNEKIAFVQYVGIAFLCICFILSVNLKNKEKSIGIKWLIFSVLAFISTGLIGIMQKIHQSSTHKDELDAFLIISFFFSFLISSIAAAIFKKQRNITDNNIKHSVINFTPIALMLISGIFVAINNKYNLFLSGVLDAAVFFPVVNGGGLILTSAAAVILFKEGLTKLQYLGIITGIISVILICNPFKS